jgi:hypothetical protein
MATDDFNRSNESPLASPWGAWGSLGTCRLVSNAVQNSAGSDTDSGCLHTTSAEHDSDWIYTSGTMDGGPAIHCATGPDGYFMTAYTGTNSYMFRLDDGSFTQLGGDILGAYVTTQRIRLRRSGNDLIYSLNAVDLMTRTDTTYTTTGNDGAFQYAANLILDGWSNNASGTAYTLAMGQGSYALTGQATGLRADRRITAVQGSYALSGQAVALQHAHKIIIAQGAYTLSGQAVTLIGPEVAYSLGMDQGSYALTGSDAAVDIEMAMESGSYALTGNAVGLAYGHKVQAAQGSYSLSGQAVGLTATRRITIDAGAYALTGNDVGLEQHDPSPTLVAESGSYTLSGQQITLQYSGQPSVGIFRNLPLNWWTKGI